MKSYRPPFPEILSATFVERPNRFIVIGQLPDGTRARAFLPNPGRLRELLLPGVTIFLTRAADTPERKTAFTMVGVAGPRHPIFLHTHVNNDVARHLIETGSIPALEGARIVRSEVTVGRSRFDFLLELRGAPLYLEVKSCTLFGNRVAMFPDAVTERGRRHLEELAHLARSGVHAAVLFVIHSGEVKWFMPDYHTDLAFSETLLAVRDTVRIIPAAITWRGDFRLSPRVRTPEIPWDFLQSEMGDRGNYLALYHDGRRHVMEIGWIPDGLFAGLKRLARRVPPGWRGLDYFALVGSGDRGGPMAARLDQCYSRHTTDRGNHWYSDDDPRDSLTFHQILADFRMCDPRTPKMGRKSCNNREKSE